MDRDLADIFEEIIDLETGEQTRALDRHCAEKPALRAKLERLLRNDREMYDRSSALPGTAVPTRALAREPSGRISGPGSGPATSASRAFGIGARIGSYRVADKLDEGGMGVVYVADHDELNRRVVIKVLRSELARRRDIVKRFRAEAHAAASIDHPGIVEVLDIGHLDDGSLFIMMEFLAGETLRHRLRRVETLPVTDAVALVKQVARALAAAHEQNIVHRDLKPSNIFLVPDPEIPGGERAKLLDFGIAKLMEEQSDRMTMANMAMGTPPYMPPEQFLDAANVDRRADLYALGVILYEMLVGRPPFKRKSLGQYVKAHTSEPPPPVRAANPAIPEALAEVIHRLLEKDRERRYRSALTLVVALAEALGEEPDDSAVQAIEAHDRRPPTGRQKLDLGTEPALALAPHLTRRRRRVRRIAVAGTAAVAVMIAASSLLVQWPKPGDAARDALATLRPLPVERDTVEAIRLVRGFDHVPVLYQALRAKPPLGIEAARVLRELEVPEAVPRIRAVLDRHGGRGRVELAACLVALGDHDAVDITRRALGEGQSLRLVAAGALAEASHRPRGDEQADVAAILRQVFEAPGYRGRDSWRRAARGLLALGHDDARAALREELTRSEPGRAIAAAAILAEDDDPVALEALHRMIRAPASAVRGEAAVILAGRGQTAALEFVADGAASPDPRNRQLAAAVAGRLARRGGERFTATLIALATGDDNRQVRFTAQVALQAIAGARRHES